MKIFQNDIISDGFYLANNVTEICGSQICLNTMKHIFFLWLSLTYNNFITKLQPNLIKAGWLHISAPLPSAELIWKNSDRLYPAYSCWKRELFSQLIPIKIIKSCKLLCPSKVLYAEVLPIPLAAKTGNETVMPGAEGEAPTPRVFLLLLLETCSEAQGKDSCSMAWPLMLEQSSPASPSPPTPVTPTEIQTASPRAAVSNSHFPLVKIELGLSVLPSQGDEERRCWGISLKHAAASVLMGCWQAGTNPCA